MDHKMGAIVWKSTWRTCIIDLTQTAQQLQVTSNHVRVCASVPLQYNVFTGLRRPNRHSRCRSQTFKDCNAFAVVSTLVCTPLAAAYRVVTAETAADSAKAYRVGFRTPAPQPATLRTSRATRLTTACSAFYKLHRVSR